jgi:hypothetical protein
MAIYSVAVNLHIGCGAIIVSPLSEWMDKRLLISLLFNAILLQHILCSHTTAEAVTHNFLE